MLAARCFRAGAAVIVALGLAVSTATLPSARAADAGPVELAVIVPIVAPPGTTGLIDAGLLEQYTAPDGQLTRELDAALGRPVTLAIDPMILASIRVLGTAAPASARAWLQQLTDAENESFLLGYADIDLTLALQAGASTAPTPDSFDFAIDPARFAAATTSSPTPTPTPDPTADPTLPTRDDLLAWDSTFPNVAWPRAGTVRSADLDALAASGVETTLLSSGNVDRDPSLGPSVTIGDRAVIVTDDTVSAALSAATTTLTPEGLSAALPALLSAIGASGSVQSGQGTVVASLDRAVALAGSNVAATLSALQADPSVILVPLSEAVAGSTTGAASLREGAADADRIAIARTLIDAESAERQFATITADPALLTGPRRLALLSLLGVAWADNTAGWATATQDFLTRSSDIRGAVQIVTTSPFTLLADSATLPIPVSNALDQAVTVYVTVRPETGQLAVSDPLVALTIEPRSQAKAAIPVQAISNGTVQILMTLTGPGGIPVGQPAITEINVQAGWETPIVLALGALVVVIFAAGLVRVALRRRRGAAEPEDSRVDG